MDISISTPALLFSAISLLLLAFTNRFLSLAGLVRELHSQYAAQGGDGLRAQLRNLRNRLRLIRASQAFGVLSFALCVGSMFLVLLDLNLAAKWVFAGSLTFMLVSLVVSLWEIVISTRALEIELAECDEGMCVDR
jgi:hypothetical protein